MTSSKYKFGIDFHGVITASPAFFRDFTALAFDRDYEVFVISGGPYLVVKNFLDSWKIRYNNIFSLIDHFASRGQVKYFPNGNFKVPDELWDKAKAEYCLQNGIDIQIDDTPGYGASFSTPFCCYNPENRTCEVGGKVICAVSGKAPACMCTPTAQFPSGKRASSWRIWTRWPRR